MRGGPGIGRKQHGVGAGLTGTIVVHALGGLLLLGARHRPAPGPPVYAVELVAAPAPPPESRPRPEAVSRPPAEKPAPDRPAPQPPKPSPPKPQPPAPTPDATEPTPRATPPVAPLPGETPGTGRDQVTVSIPGLEFPFPDYLRNIVQEVYRRWQRPQSAAPLRAEVSFLILRDGTVREIRLVRPSGSFSFDLAVQGAVEAAGTARAFGALPDGYPADVLPVSFYFTPRNP